MNVKSTLFAAILLLASTAASAQDLDITYPHWFVGVQGGVHAQPLSGKLNKLSNPTFGLQVGRWITDDFGLRVQGLGYEQKGLLKKAYSGTSGDSYGKYKAWAGKVDLLVNMSNMIYPNRIHNRLDWIVFMGLGVNGVWDTKDSDTEGTKATFGIGTQLEYMLTSNLGVSGELQLNARDVITRTVECNNMLHGAALIGLTYHFGKVKKVTPVAAPTTTANDYTSANNDADLAAAAAKKAQAEELARAEAARKAAEAKKAAETAKTAAKAVVKDEPLNETIFFNIGSSDHSNSTVLDKVASWAKKYPSKKVVVSGYADKGTGSAPVNMKVSQQRINSVVSALKAKGVSASQITSKAYGDTTQPYAVNDQNRCTIFVGE